MFAHCHGIASKIRKRGFGMVAVFIEAGGVVFAGFPLGVGFVVLVTSGPSRALALDAMKGKQMLPVGTWCRPDPKAKEIKALRKRVDEQFEEMFPKEAKYMEDREGYVGPAQVSALSRDSVLPGLGGGEAVGLAVSVGYCGRSKPSVKATVAGLLHVGHDATGARYLGTHQAVSSGMRTAPVIGLYHEERSMFGK